jgi:hypothetical protein
MKYSKFLVVALLLLLSSAVFADTYAGDGSAVSGWTTGEGGDTYFNHTSADGAWKNVGFCMAGGGNCNPLAGNPGALPFWSVSPTVAPQNILFDASGSANSVSLLISVAGMKATDMFGVYNVADPTQMVSLGSGVGTSATGFNPADLGWSQYGFFLSNSYGTFYSQAGVAGGADSGNQHFVVFQGQGGSYFLGMEDKPFNIADQDFNDILIRVQAVPEPTTLVLMASGLLAGAGALRRKLIA